MGVLAGEKASAQFWVKSLLKVLTKLPSDPWRYEYLQYGASASMGKDDAHGLIRGDDSRATRRLSSHLCQLASSLVVTLRAIWDAWAMASPARPMPTKTLMISKESIHASMPGRARSEYM